MASDLYLKQPADRSSMVNGSEKGNLLQYCTVPQGRSALRHALFMMPVLIKMVIQTQPVCTAHLGGQECTKSVPRKNPPPR